MTIYLFCFQNSPHRILDGLFGWFGGMFKTVMIASSNTSFKPSCRYKFSCYYCNRTFLLVNIWKLAYALSFYRSQYVLGWSKFFVPDQRFNYILWQSQTFCARQKDDLHSVKLVFVPAQKFLKRH